MAYGDIVAIDTGIFDAVRGSLPHVIHISGDVYAVAYTGVDNDGFVATVSITDAGVVGAIIDFLEFDIAECYNARIAHVAGDIYVVTYMKPVATDLEARTFTIDAAGNIGAATLDTRTLDGAIQGTGGCDLITIDAGVFAVAYSGAGNDGWLLTFSVDGAGNISAPIDTFEFDGFDGRNPSIIHINADVYAIAYNQNTSIGRVSTIDIDAAGNIGAALLGQRNFEPTWCDSPIITHIAGAIYAISYQELVGADNTGVICTIAIYNNGTVGPAVIDTYTFEATNAYDIHHVNAGTNIFFIAFSSVGADGFCITVTIDDNGNITPAIIDTLEFDAIWGTESFILQILDRVIAIFYYHIDVGAPGNITTFNVEIYLKPSLSTSPATNISLVEQ